jgi:hypothetical protein
VLAQDGDEALAISVPEPGPPLIRRLARAGLSGPGHVDGATTTALP